MFLEDVLIDIRIKKIILPEEDTALFPKIFLKHVWDHEFAIKFLEMPGMQVLIAQATQIHVRIPKLIVQTLWFRTTKYTQYSAIWVYAN